MWWYCKVNGQRHMIEASSEMECLERLIIRYSERGYHFPDKPKSLELECLEGWEPPYIDEDWVISGTALPYADRIEAAMYELENDWWNAQTPPPDYSSNRTYDSFRLIFKTLEFDWEYTKVILAKHGLNARTLSSPLYPAEPGWLLRECRVEFQKTMTVRILTPEELEIELQNSRESVMNQINVQ